MNSLFWLIPIGLILLVIAVLVFIWAVKHEQFSDLESPAYDILFDDDKILDLSDRKD